MKLLKSIAAVLVLMAAASGNAWADHGYYHHHSRVFIGVGPFWDPWFYAPPPAYYYPPPVVYTSPPVYIEQTPAPAPAANYWYYCAHSKRYYPYVKECPGGWQQVAPLPPDAK